MTPSANDEHGLPEGYNFNHRRFGWYRDMQGSGPDIIRKRNDIPENLPSNTVDPTIDHQWAILHVIAKRDSRDFDPDLRLTGPTKDEEIRSNAQVRSDNNNWGNVWHSGANSSSSSGHRKGGGKRSFTPDSEKGYGKNKRARQQEHRRY